MTHEDYKRTAEALLAEMSCRTAKWDWLRKRILPHAQADADLDERPSSDNRRTHSSAACKALHILAGAHVMYITPTGQQWFSLESGKKGTRETSDRLESWFTRATEITHRALAESNFYTIIHQCFIDRCLTGTGCVFCHALPDGKLNFEYVATGTYAISDGADGNVDTIARIFKMTAHEAAERFGLNTLPDTVREAYADPRRSHTEKHSYVHLVVPRPNAQFGVDVMNPRRMRFASVYMFWEGGDKPVISESGFNEFPFLVTRFLRWGESPYGWAPGQAVEEEIDTSLKLERIMDVLGEIAAFPRYLMFAEHVGEVDFRAGGRTVIKPAAAQANMPREWLTGGRYDVGKDRIEQKEQKINDAFFVNMLQVISPIDRPMTATEVTAREAEKVLAFAPSMSLFVSDCSPFINRIFSVLFRLGKYPQDTGLKALLVPDAGGSENFEVKLPSVAFNGKISQAIDRAQRGGAEAYIATSLEFAKVTGNTAMLDIVDWNEYAKWAYKLTGAPAECLLRDADLRALNDRKRTAEDQAQGIANAQGVASAARDLSQAQAAPQA